MPFLFLEEICVLILLCASSQPLQQGLYCSWYSCIYLLLQVNAICRLAVYLIGERTALKQYNIRDIS